MPGPDARSKRIVLHQDQSARQIADTLAAEGIIRYPNVFALLARLTGYERAIRTGRYLLPIGASEYRALRLVQAAGEKDAFVTIPEGFTLNQIATRLEENGVCDRLSFTNTAGDPDLLARLGIQAPSAEGYLFPDSYYLPLGADPAEVIRLMHSRLLTVFRQLVADGPSDSKLQPSSVGDSGPQSPVPSPQLVTLASIVEAEAELDGERAIIASVFLNRLKRRMPLQSCATVEYVLPERKPVLSEADTKIESPYNTYIHPGLPPGPIGNPGRASLRAALYPARTDYLFFVSRGDRSHCFSATFAAHAEARRRYLQR